MVTDENKTCNASSKHVRLNCLLAPREHKYRAWIKTNNKMIYPLGFYKQLLDRNGNGEANYYLYGDTAFDDTIYKGKKDDVVLMEFIGIKDQNNKKIYEGDIIDSKISYGGKSLQHRGIVVYKKEFASFATKNKGGVTLFCKHLLNTFKIIGNIFENPELLE